MVSILSPSGVELPDPGETFSRAQYNRNVTKTNDSWVAREAQAKGLVAIDERTTTSTVNAGTNVIQFLASFTFKANRWYHVEWFATLVPSVANQQGLMQIHTCSTADASNATTGLTEIRGVNVNAPGTFPIPGYASRKIKYGADTTLQIKATTNGGTGTLGTQAGPTYPSQLCITDLGTQI